MQVNNINSNQSFGMAMNISKKAKDIISGKIKKYSHFQLLESFTKKQANNPFKIDIQEEAGYLKSYIKDTSVKNLTDYEMVYSLKESWIDKYFGNPLNFIKRCCKIANELYTHKKS